MIILNKPNWEITATTVYCDGIDDEVTLIVYTDGTSRCTGRDSYARSDKEKSTTLKKKIRKQKLSGCSADGCPRVKQYRESILHRENIKL
jgi:hypothetical protein